MPKPEMKTTVDLDPLKKMLSDYVDAKECEHGDCDCEHYIYETALETFYGPEVWDYINNELIK